MCTFIIRICGEKVKVSFILISKIVVVFIYYTLCNEALDLSDCTNKLTCLRCIICCLLTPFHVHCVLFQVFGDVKAVLDKEG